MKTRDRIIISLLAGFLAMTLQTAPMWWGVLFSPISQSLTCEAITEENTVGYCLKADGIIFRFKSLDLLLSFLRLS